MREPKAKKQTPPPAPRDYAANPLKAGDRCVLGEAMGGPVMCVERTRANPDNEAEQLGDVIWFDERNVDPQRASILLVCLREH